MEKINLDNYEAYFLDYMEGALGAEEKMDLFAFLEKHPHLKEEMEEDFGVVELIPTSVTLDFKNELKKKEDEFILTPGTVEEAMIASVEGQLSKEEQATLDAYIKDNGLEKTMEIFRATRLKADKGIIYPNKKELKQKDTRVIAMPWLIRASAIAAVGLLLITVAMNWGDGTDPVGITNGENSFASDYKSPTKQWEEKRRMEEEENLPETIESFAPAGTDQMAYEESPRREETIPNEEEDKEEGDGEEITPFIPNDSPLPDDFAQERKDNLEIKKENEENDPGEENQESPRQLPPLDDEYIEEDDVASTSGNAGSKSEEPYKLVTNAASDLINRDVRFTRKRDVASNDYVGYGFKLGKFEFERKKSK